MKRSGVIRAIRASEILLTVGILTTATLSIFHARSQANDSAPLKSRGAALDEISAQLQGVFSHLQSYLHDHQAAQLDQLNASGKAVTHFIGVYKSVRADDAQKDPEQVEARYDAMRASTLALLKADAAVEAKRSALVQVCRTLASLFKDQIFPSIRPQQMRSEERLAAARLAQIQADAILHQSADNTRFHEAILQFQELSGTRRAQRWAHEAEQLFALAQLMSHESIQLSQTRNDALVQTTGAFHDLLDSLQAAQRLEGDDGALGFLSRLPAVIHGAMAGWTFFLFLLLACLLAADRTLMERQLTSLDAVVQTAESACSGDLAAPPAPVGSGEAGRLASAVNRLISVLGRSENLVYHLAALVESSGEAIVSQNLDGKILSWNKGAQRIYGYCAEEVKSRSITMLASPECAAMLTGPLERIRRGERILPFEMVHQAKNGRSIRVMVRIAAILNSTRQVIGASYCGEEIRMAATTAATPAPLPPAGLPLY